MKNSSVKKPNSLPLKIFILEDDPNDVLLIEHQIKQLNLPYQIQIATNGGQYLNGILDFEPDIILADYNLPDFDGLKALKIASTVFPEVPFVFVSGAIHNEEWNDADILPEVKAFVLKSNLNKLKEVLLNTFMEVSLAKTPYKWSQKSDEEINSITENLTNFFTIMDRTDHKEIQNSLESNHESVPPIFQFNRQLRQKYGSVGDYSLK